MAEDERDPFAGLGWKVEIVRLADPYIPLNSSPERCPVVNTYTM